MTSIAELAEGYKRGDYKPTEVVAATLQRLEEKDEELGFLQCAMTEIANTAALESDVLIASGNPRPLEGIPFGIKDIIAVEGVPTTFGSPGFQDDESETTATVVKRIKDAGAVPVAKLRTYEFAAGPNSLTKNPFDRMRTSGGSSSGSAAALGAGLLPLALGTDTGGSVRVPAAWCGTVGLKPTYGWISRYGVAPLSWTLDHVGILGQSAADCGTVLGVLAGRDPLDPYSVAPAPIISARRGARVGIPKHWSETLAQPAVSAAASDAGDRLRDVGFDVFEIEIPELDDLNPDIVKHILVSAEAASLHAGSQRSYGAKFAELLQIGDRISATDYIGALRMRSILQSAVNRAFEECDYLMTPTCPITAPPIGEESVPLDGQLHPLTTVVVRYTSLFNITGHPAITVPFASDQDGMPIGIQLVGRLWDDDAIVGVASSVMA